MENVIEWTWRFIGDRTGRYGGCGIEILLLSIVRCVLVKDGSATSEDMLRYEATHRSMTWPAELSYSVRKDGV